MRAAPRIWLNLGAPNPFQQIPCLRHITFIWFSTHHPLWKVKEQFCPSQCNLRPLLKSSFWCFKYTQETKKIPCPQLKSQIQTITLKNSSILTVTEITLPGQLAHFNVPISKERDSTAYLHWWQQSCPSNPHGDKVCQQESCIPRTLWQCFWMVGSSPNHNKSTTNFFSWAWEWGELKRTTRKKTTGTPGKTGGEGWGGKGANLIVPPRYTIMGNFDNEIIIYWRLPALEKKGAGWKGLLSLFL